MIACHHGPHMPPPCETRPTREAALTSWWGQMARRAEAINATGQAQNSSTCRLGSGITMRKGRSKLQDVNTHAWGCMSPFPAWPKWETAPSKQPANNSAMSRWIVPAHRKPAQTCITPHPRLTGPLCGDRCDSASYMLGRARASDMQARSLATSVYRTSAPSHINRSPHIPGAPAPRPTFCCIVIGPTAMSSPAQRAQRDPTSPGGYRARSSQHP